MTQCYLKYVSSNDNTTVYYNKLHPKKLCYCHQTIVQQVKQMSDETVINSNVCLIMFIFICLVSVNKC
jgi:hypothetical protein